MKRFFWLLSIVLLFSTTYATVRLNEIAWSGTPTSSNDEWIELFNDGEESVSLENWTLISVDGTPEILLSGEIEPGGFFLLERTDNTTVPGQEADQIYTGALGNTGEELTFNDAEGNEIGRTPTGMWLAGTSTPERRSMVWVESEWRTFEGEANEDGIWGSPGMANESIIPEEPSPEPTSVRFSEIAPVSIGEPEWFEVEIFADEPIDLSGWIIRRGSSEVSLNILETGLETWNPRRLVGNPSPLSLPDDGGTIEILNKDSEIVATATWEETKSGTSDDIPWGEIWNWDSLKYWPLQSSEDSPTHTRGAENRETPVFPEQIRMRIEEIAPNRLDGIDFIELYIEQSPDDAILPHWNVKHNGTELFASGGEIVNTGDRITLFLKSEKISEDPVRWMNRTNSNNISATKIWESSTKNGLNKSSGTLELNIWTGTSWEQTEDFVCWAEETLSATEQARVNNHPDDWAGPCFVMGNMVKNESIARFVGGADSNGATDFFRHFNGSPEDINLPQNTPPIPKILVQGGRRVYETSLNLTGLDEESATTDPDGEHDLKYWNWEIDGTSCGNYETNFWEWSNVRNGTKTCEEESTRDNPGLIYFNFGAKEAFSVTLTVEDYSGAKESITVELNKDPFNVGGGGSNVFDASLKKWMAKELGKEAPQERNIQLLGPIQRVGDDFFDDFLLHLDYKKIDPRLWKPSAPKETFLPKRMRDRIPESVRSKLKKNIGLIFLY